MQALSNDHFLVLDVFVALGDGAQRLQEQTVTQLHNVGFVNGVNLLAAATLGVFKSEAGDSGGSAFGDNFQAFDDAGNDFVLEGRSRGLQCFRGPGRCRRSRSAI